jgi:thiamine biosynthesis lipoprotein
LTSVPIREVREVMGMPVTVVVAGAEGAAAAHAIEAAFDEFALLDRTFSLFRAESEVSQVDRGELQLSAAGALVGQAAELCRLYEQATGGYFSAWHGGRFDPSGLVKGWAIDRACSILDRHSCRDYFVDAGGDLQTRGRSADGDAWRVGIRHPVSRDQVVRVILAEDLAVATSGSYEKGDHIRNPFTGRPAGDWLSFTVAGPDILTADIYATACFAMGEEGLRFIEGTAGYEAYGIRRNLVASWTAGFDALCAPSAGTMVADARA